MRRVRCRGVAMAIGFYPPPSISHPAAVAPRAASELQRTGADLGLVILKGLLDRRPFPVVVVDASATVCAANGAAKRDALRYGLTAEEGCRLKVGDADTSARLLRLIRQAARCDADVSRDQPFLEYEVRGRALSLSLSRLSDASTLDADRSFLLVSIRDAPGFISLSPDLVMDAFGMTRAEAALSVALIRNMSLQDYCEAEGIKISTARWHLKNIFQRTGARSQSELVALIMITVL